IQRIEARHAHQLRLSVDFRRARSAFAGLAIPAHSDIVGLLVLDAVHGIENHHAAGDFSSVIHEFAAAVVAAPDTKRRLIGHAYLFSSITCFISSVSGTTGTRSSCGRPSAPLLMRRLYLPHSALFSG